MRSLRPLDARILELLEQKTQPEPIDRLAAELALDQSPVAGALTLLVEDGLVTATEEEAVELRAGSKAPAWQDGRSPERAVADALARSGGRADMKTFAAAAGLDAKVVGESLRWLTARGWATREGGSLVLAAPYTADAPAMADEVLVSRLLGAAASPEQLAAEGVPVEAGLALLAQRPGVVDRRTRKRRLAEITPAGRALAAQGFTARAEVNELTTEMLVSGRWREVEFRAYDVTLPGPKLVPGREHPFRRILERTRRVFLEMGFSETRSPWVESGFWDFDALFQPQDHPARDMQDTFYVGNPERAHLPDAALVERVRRVHEDGGDTGSIGWRYRWSADPARQTVLRTHTTSASIQALARDPVAPRKVFCVGPVFRREAIDFKHLPVFHQVDGIVVDEAATFAGLLALLRAFYRKMGFERVQFRPDFFPYTEPSVGVHVWLESRGAWLEMGGAGMFRPEVTSPLGCTAPVLAWGLGLERLAMLRYGLSDIRELYLSHLSWLEEAESCRS